jgi:RNA polymerase sigma factor (sigma-70 family)
VSRSQIELIQLAVVGDSGALTELLQQHGPALRAQFASAIPTRWHALLSVDDLIQETFTDACLDVVGFDTGRADSFAAWLSAIARHNLANAVAALEADRRGGTRRKVEPTASDDSFTQLFELLATTSSTPSRQVARSEATTALEQAIDRLPETYQQVVRLYDLQGWEVTAVAKVLGRSPGAVFMLRARAHRALRRLLGAPANYFTDFA